MTARGRFVTFEGGEGVGKSTQIAALAERLRAAEHDVVVTREPGGTVLAEAIRTLVLDPSAEGRTPTTEALLFAAARSDHVSRLIAPSLAQGRWVLCDRFADSTRAYQGAAGDLDREFILSLEAAAVAGMPGEIGAPTKTLPDVTILLDLDPEVGLRRVAQRAAGQQGVARGPLVDKNTDRGAAPDGFEARTLAYHRRLRQGFLDEAAAAPERFAVFDAAQPVDVLAHAIWRTVGERLGVS
ncbi:MAG: dTMP kinase [Pseudomonadota bacterium]